MMRRSGFGRSVWAVVRRVLRFMGNGQLLMGRYSYMTMPLPVHVMRSTAPDDGHDADGRADPREEKTTDGRPSSNPPESHPEHPDRRSPLAAAEEKLWSELVKHLNGS